MKQIYLLATSVDIRMDLDLALNFVKAARRLFCDICPCSGTAIIPKLLSNRAVLIVLLQVAQNIMNEFPDISLRI